MKESIKNNYISFNVYKYLSEAEYQKVIHQVEVPIVDFNTCQEWYSAQEVVISDTMLCAGFAEGQKDACQVSTRYFLCKLPCRVIKEK